MIDDISLSIVEESISIVVESDVIHNFRHRGVIDFNTNDADKLSFIIYRNVIGNHAGTEIFRNIRRLPDTFSCRLWHSKPDQRRGIVRIIIVYIGNLMLLETVVIRMNVPEAFDVPGDFRVNPIIVCQDAIGVVHQLLKNISDPIHMGLKFFVIQTIQV